MSDRFVLVVDDDDATQILMSRYLESLNIRALVAANGQQALEVLKEYEGEIGLILVDIAMPGMNGYELARIIRTELGLVEVPLLALTARSGPDVEAQAAAAGINDIIPKPFEAKQIKRILAELTLLQ